MIRGKFAVRAMMALLAAAALASCDRERTNFPALPAVTEVTITNYKTVKPYGETSWKITDAQRIGRLVALVDAQKADWRSMNSANFSEKKGVTLKFNGPAVKRTFVIYPTTFENSYAMARGNLWAMEGEYPNVSIGIVIKELSDAAHEKLRAAVLETTAGLKPQPTATPLPAPKVAPTAQTK